MRPTYQGWIDGVVSLLPKKAKAKQVVQLWYDYTDPQFDIRKMDLDLLEAMIKKWKDE